MLESPTRGPTRRPPNRPLKRRLRLIALAAGPIALLAFGRSGPPQAQAQARAALHGRIVAMPSLVRVSDGDTFRYAGTRIRIADIDAPEINGRCAREKQLAARATRRLRALLGAGPFTIAPADRDEDRYGRKLRIIARGGRSIGLALVREGLARPWSGKRLPWCD